VYKGGVVVNLGLWRCNINFCWLGVERHNNNKWSKFSTESITLCFLRDWGCGKKRKWLLVLVCTLFIPKVVMVWIF